MLRLATIITMQHNQWAKLLCSYHCILCNWPTKQQ